MHNKRKAYLRIGLFFFALYIAKAQDQRISDSLISIYKADSLQGEQKLELLRNLSFNETNDYNLAMQYANELIVLAERSNNLEYQTHGYFQKGNAKRLQGDLQEAINAYFKSAEFAQKSGLKRFEGGAYSAVADIYSISDDHKNASSYYQKAISTLRKSEDSINLASVIMNYGDDLMNNKKYDSALVYFDESGKIFEQVNYIIGKAYNLGNIGMVHANQGRNYLAEKNINEAVEILEAYEDYYAVSVYLLSMADIYIEIGDQNLALEYALKSLDLAKKYGLKEQIGDANLKLSELYESLGNPSQSLMHYKDHILYRDSLINIKNVKEIANLTKNFEISQKQLQVEKVNQQKRNQLIILGLVGLGFITLIFYYKAISKEKRKSENLLLNILPAEIAHELKHKGNVESVKCEAVTVLFTDFVQFSKVAEHVTPKQLVKSIDHYFKKFDAITEKHGLEKIKTVGDAYMCASGLPNPNPDHAKNAIKVAKEMAEVVKQELSVENGLTHFEIRIGLHSGPVVAGIVGLKKWQYDIWGDTVNIAARMESASEPGRVNLSETTYQEIKDEFECEYRGELEVKHRGKFKMYFLS